jgi:hypothetical protein
MLLYSEALITAAALRYSHAAPKALEKLLFPGAAVQVPVRRSPAAEPPAAEPPVSQLYSLPAAELPVSQPFSPPPAEPPARQPFSLHPTAAAADLQFSEAAVRQAASRQLPGAAIVKAHHLFSEAAAAAAAGQQYPVAAAERAVRLLIPAAAGAAGAVQFSAVHPDQAGVRPGLHREAAGRAVPAADHPAGRNYRRIEPGNKNFSPGLCKCIVPATLFYPRRRICIAHRIVEFSVRDSSEIYLNADL